MGVVGVLSPRRATYNVVAENNVTLRPLSLDVYNRLNVNASTLKVEEGTSYHVSGVPVDAGLSAAFATSGFIPAQSLESTTTLHLTDNGRNSLTGQVHNTTSLNLQDAVVVTMGGAYYVGRAPAGRHELLPDQFGGGESGVASVGERRAHRTTSTTTRPMVRSAAPSSPTC